MLMQSPHLPPIPVRAIAMACAAFMFGDASGTGFRQSLWLLGGEEIDIFHGLWDDEAVERSSNWREFYNQVLGVERGLKRGTIMKGTELFLFTNNFVTEHAYFSGTSKSKTLFEVILRLQHLEMKGELFIHLIWVAGTRIIEQGTDGVSQGDLVNGVMGGKVMLNFIPLNLGVHQRAPDLVKWIAETCGGNWKILASKEWFHEVHLQEGRFIWSPAPAIADVTLEQLCEMRHTRPSNAHIFLCPALMTLRWRKCLGKVMDAMFTVPMGSTHWSLEMHEPVVIALICPLLAAPGRSDTHQSWLSSSITCQECRVPISPLNGIVCANFGLTRNIGRVCRAAWHGLCYKQDTKDRFLVLQACGLEESLLGPEELEEEDPNRFRMARDGDHLMCPFQCDECHFYNIQKRRPGARPQDSVLLMCIRCANLDAFWSQESATMVANLREGARALGLCA